MKTTDDLDVDLRARLGRLASAVPVDAGNPVGSPIVSAVRPGSTSRQFAGGAFAALVLVVGVATVGASLARIGPFAPSATGDGPVTSTVRNGPFELTIRSARSHYAPGDVIDVKASLTYRGPEASLSIAHAHGSPMAFGVVERVGSLFLIPAWRQSCERSTLEPGVPLERPFAKSGSFSGDNPAATNAAGFFEDPTLELPAGTWNLYVVADFGVGDCGVDRHLLRADLPIVVGDSPSDPSATLAASNLPIERPSAALPTAAPEPTTADLPMLGTDAVGPYTIELRSERAVYYESDQIKVTGAFSYSGDKAIDVSGFWPLLFSVDEPVYGINIWAIHTLMCTNSILAPGERIEQPFAKGGGVTASGAEADIQRAYLSDPEFRLPPGTWHIRLNASFAEGSDCRPEISLSAALEIVVLPDP